ncbi:hypothetical protein [Kitasatospora sp. NPDC056184]|uniref:Lsr2 family DNA-binding protein n=1 Tax=Kitasatospora sp. NPDC056184 TaxID=3345738 RepID=UPI0035D91048
MADEGTVREWLRAQGYEVNPRGRVPGPLVERYEAAHPDEAHRAPVDPAPAPPVAFAFRFLADDVCFAEGEGAAADPDAVLAALRWAVERPGAAAPGPWLRALWPAVEAFLAHAAPYALARGRRAVLTVDPDLLLEVEPQAPARGPAVRPDRPG